MRIRHRHAGPMALATLFLLPAVAAGAFANFESTAVHPIRVSADGQRLYVVHTVDHRLAVYGLQDPARPVLLREIPVGLEPVSVAAHTGNEVWVANLLSDSVSVVDVDAGVVIDTLRVVDEPSDVVFAAGRAFVSAAVRDQIHVFDAATRAPLGVVPVFGNEPRALAASPDGARVYALVHRSGNGTTIIHHGDAPAPPPPWNPDLGPAPQAGLIVRADDPAFASVIPFTLPDHDVIEIDAATATVVRGFPAIGTINFDLVADSATGDVLVANTEARNLVRFEPVLRGHLIDSRITRVTTGPAPSVVAADLHPGVDYGLLPNPAALGTALADPTGLALDAAARLLYVAAQGTDRIGVLAADSLAVLARIEVGGTPGAAVDTRAKRGPRGLALHPSGAWLYVANRLSDTLTVIDTATRGVVAEVPVGRRDPMPAALRTGRKFLYDAKLSGNGTASCASCHVDGDGDDLSWDLGNPDGALAPVPLAVRFDPGDYLPFHPMKGPMFTQTLRGLDGVGPLHWRGDRADFEAFNVAFEGLMGGAQLAADDMALFAEWGRSIRYPPNPNQALDRTLRTEPATASEQRGFEAFVDTETIGPGCVVCHAVADGIAGGPGTIGLIRSLPIGETQQMKIAQLRNLYRKADFFRKGTGPQKVGFGATHDGSNGGAIGSLAGFVNSGLFAQQRFGEGPHVNAFLLAWDTGTAPTVGYQTMLDAARANAPSFAADRALLEARAAAGDIDLVVAGEVRGQRRGYVFDPATRRYVPAGAGTVLETAESLAAQARARNARLVFTGVVPGTGADVALPDAGPAIVLVRTKSLTLKDGAAAARRFVFKAAGSGRTPSGVVVPASMSAGDPTLRGARLALTLGTGAGSVVAFDLPAALWKRTKTGYAYADRRAVRGAINSVVLQPEKLVVKGKGGLLPSLAGAPHGEIAVGLRLGDGIETCGAAPARAPASSHDTAAKFTGVAGSPPPAACPVEP